MRPQSIRWKLTAWYVAVLFCATGDAFQAPLIRRASVPGSRWQWLAWDMDFSFRVPVERPRYGWQRDTLHPIVRAIGDPNNLARVLLYRLLTESPEYRAALVDRITAALNHQLTPAYLKALLEQHRAFLEGAGETDLRFLEELEDFFQHRPDALRDQVRRGLQLEYPRPLTVRSAGSAEIDGHPVEAGWTGWYFPGQRITIATADETVCGWWREDRDGTTRQRERRWTFPLAAASSPGEPLLLRTAPCQ